MDEDLRILKEQWSKLSARTDKLEEANRIMAGRMASTKTTSLQSRLAKRVTRMGWLGLLLPVLSPVIYYELGLPWWISLAYAVFGVVMSIISFGFGEYIKSETLTEMPVSDAIERASRIRTFQNIVRTLGMILSMSLIATMAFYIPEGPEREAILVGGGIGFAVGLVIGLRRCFVNARIARQLIKSLK